MDNVSRRGPVLSNRRTLMIGAGVIALWPRLAMARDGFVIDWMGAPADPAVAAFLDGQIRLVEALPISADAMAFFRAETIHVDPTEGTKTRPDAASISRVVSSRPTIRCCSTN